MPEPIIPPAEAKEEVKTAEVDAFGSSNTPIEPTKPVEKSEKKGEDLDDKHPVVQSLKKQIDDVKSEYGGNLAGQRKVIEALEQQIKELKVGKGGEGEGEADVLFKEIKRSKDLKQDEKDEMTDTEIKQMDEIADMKEAQNKMYAEQMKKGKEEMGKEEKKATDVQSLVKETALELAGDDVAMANQIIEIVKQFDLKDLSEDKVKERVLNATKLVPDYKAPKEQKRMNGKPVKQGGAGGDDPFGNNKTIEEATKSSEGNYSL